MISARVLRVVLGKPVGQAGPNLLTVSGNLSEWFHPGSENQVVFLHLLDEQRPPILDMPTPCRPIHRKGSAPPIRGPDFSQIIVLQSDIHLDMPTDSGINTVRRKMKPLLAIITFLGLSGCGFFFGPGFGSTDKHYFAEPPVVVRKDSQYVLRWQYGSMGFVFYPRYEVRNASLVFSLQGTTSSGDRAGKEQELPIEGAAAIAALEKGGAFWWEPDGSLTPIALKGEANHAPDPTASAVTPAADAPVAPASGRGSS